MKNRFMDSFNAEDEDGISPRKKLRSALIILGFILILFTIHAYAFANKDSAQAKGQETTVLPLVTKPAVEPTQQLEQKQKAKKKASATSTNKAKKATKGKCSISKAYPESIQQWCAVITKYAKQSKLDPDLVASVIWQESGGNSSAYSPSGAVGLMQVMPRDGIAASFMCVSGPCFQNRPTTGELQDPEFNISYGTGMLSALVKKHGDVREALVAYGPANVGYYYSDKVLNLYQSYKGE